MSFKTNKFKSYPRKKVVYDNRKKASFKRTGAFLIIVESPSKCSSIETYLGGNYNVIASCGHITAIESMKDIDIKNDFSPTYKIKEDKTAHVAFMRFAIEQYSKDNVIIATDDDREGEGIAYAIATTFNLPIETTKRIIFNEVTKTAIQTAVASPMRINMSLVLSQQARQILDIIIGFKVSPILWKYIYHSKTNALSAGRCQTPALMLVYENYIKGTTSVPRETYDITGFFLPKNLSFKLNHRFETVLETSLFMEESIVHKHIAKMGDKRFLKKSPPRPLNTSQLLQQANNILHFSPKSTMQTAQALYQSGYITYMRTDSQTYSSDFINSVDMYITKTYGDRKYVGELSGIENRVGTNPHEAIRITNISIYDIPMEDSRMKSLYKLIWRNSVESCMSDATFNAYTITISAPQNHKYSYVHEEPIFMGWKQMDLTLTKIGKKKQEVDTTGTLLYMWALPKNGEVVYKQITAQVSQQCGHQHYSESTLIHRLEELGIGRPSTYAMFIETIQERGYVSKEDVEGHKSMCTDFRLCDGVLEKTLVSKIFGAEKGRLVMQPVGKICIEFLSQHFSELFDYSYTKTMEEELDIIANSPVMTSRSVSDILTQPVRTEYLVCKRTFDDISRQIKSISKLKKEEYVIDDRHVLTFQQFGPCVIRTLDNGEKEYIPVKKTLASSIDLDKIRRKEYSLDELLEFRTPLLGNNSAGIPVLIKVGKFGAFIECGDTKKSIKTMSKPLDELSLDEAIMILNGEMDTDVASQKGVLRILNEDFSIRKGRFGHYCYYRTREMTTPRFFSLKKFDNQYLDCSEYEVIEWVNKTYLS